MNPIGRVVNTVREARDSGWGEVVSELRLSPGFADGLLGLDGFSHAVVVFLMHEAEFRAAEHLRRHPQERADLPLLGIFAQRARHRPNPIGVTTVAIERIEGASVFVRGLDAIDGTPILDIKPHVASYDSPADTREPEWVRKLMQGYL
jgi:tRNA-Thr(GGU) m(6)t(6)A37 methyltransferase TsaA